MPAVVRRDLAQQPGILGGRRAGPSLSGVALVTSDGGPQSHTAILARQLGLPAIVAAKGIDAIADGTEVFVDGARGVISD